ncbi:Glycosyl hydrolases family 17 protein [Hordeum vulgare]|nr:Glycosyl hydrolases family 17 protein [Hordeum vulgare]
MPLFLLLLVLLLPATPVATPSALLGINYGRVGNNLPPTASALQLLAGLGVGRVRLYDADPATLRSFAKRASSSSSPALPATKIAVLAIGNEVLTGANSSALTPSLFPAMQCIHDALVQLGLDKQVAVTTAHNLGVLATSYPPSSAYFRKDLLPVLCPILDFHARTGSPFLVNAYPYFAYAEDPAGVELEYALLDPGHGGVPDPSSGLRYPNMLVAQMDAVYHAIAATNRVVASAVEVRVPETGWPSAGDSNETGATPWNAARYNGNVMRLVGEGKGTPLRPDGALRVYMFALFNENMKPGPSSERNYGLFKPDGTPVYELAYRYSSGTCSYTIPHDKSD